MKFKFWSGLLVLIFLTACQTATPPTTQAPDVNTPDTSPMVPPTATATSLPEKPEPTPPEEGYPAPTVEVSPPPANIPPGYPEPNEEVSWNQAKSLILDGQVAEVFQFHSMKVILVLKDGRVLSTFETAIDEIFTIIEQCGEVCSDITIATE